MKTAFPTYKPVFTGTDLTNKNNSLPIKNALRDLYQKFLEIPEIGKFKPIKVVVNQPLPGSRINKATIMIEPSVNPQDFRTRVLTFVTHSPLDEKVTHEISPASGNKFSIESTLKNPKTARVFENFINEAEDILF